VLNYLEIKMLIDLWWLAVVIIGIMAALYGVKKDEMD
jgi:hypothetical protein